MMVLERHSARVQLLLDSNMLEREKEKELYRSKLKAVRKIATTLLYMLNNVGTAHP